jgi:signal peptidase I
MIHWFSPGWLKKADRFSKGVKKFIAYQRDLMPEEKLSEVLAAKSEYDAAMKSKDRAALEGDGGLEKKLLRLCEKAVPNYNSSPLKENMEVIIVAIIVALGIRAYYLQPFKIPTSSMQPTLNGIIGTRMAANEEPPNIVTQAWQFAWNGRNYTECRVPKEWGDVELLTYQQTSRVNFFTFTTLTFSNRQTITCYAPAKQLLQDIVHHPEVRQKSEGVQSDDMPAPKQFGTILRDATGHEISIKPEPVKLKGGDLIAKGYIESGDQLLVDKVSYHFRRPKRDEVFVFYTKDIPALSTKPTHYIKRLVALPGDTVGIEQPKLLVNGEVVTAPGSAKVASGENGYKGYRELGVHAKRHVNGPGVVYDFSERAGYVAFGDNSENSSDSRYWGTVPESGLVGPALFTYWPFANHFGLIR